jgi:hypothetical protein
MIYEISAIPFRIKAKTFLVKKLSDILHDRDNLYITGPAIEMGKKWSIA